MSKSKETPKEAVTVAAPKEFKAYSIVRKNGGYSIVTLTCVEDKITEVSTSVEDVLSIILSKIQTIMRPE